jgi:hypothetical protein
MGGMGGMRLMHFEGGGRDLVSIAGAFFIDSKEALNFAALR